MDEEIKNRQKEILEETKLPLKYQQVIYLMKEKMINYALLNQKSELNIWKII